MTSLATVGGYLATWIARANQAWGTSRAWNSGSSFETDLTAMTADRNTWVSNSNTWQTRANQAWGPSGVWNNGASWQSKYTANDNVRALNSQTFTLSATANQSFQPATITGTPDNVVLGNQGTYLNIGRPGIFKIYVHGATYTSIGVRIITDSVQRAEAVSSVSFDDFLGDGAAWVGQVNSSIQFQLKGRVTLGATCIVTFVPTPGAPS